MICLQMKMIQSLRTSLTTTNWMIYTKKNQVIFRDVSRLCIVPGQQSYSNISETPTQGTKRPREEEHEAPQLVDTSKSTEIDTTGLSKSQKKKLKKQKLKSGEAAPVNGTEKKVQFAPKLEQGPTKSTSESTTKAAPAKPAISPKEATEVKPEKRKVTLANGVVIEEHKIGSGPKAKNGTKLGIRYIGKLTKNGKKFDENTKGHPFRFVLGKGEVIKGTMSQKRELTVNRMGHWFGRDSTWRGEKDPYSCHHGIWIEIYP